MSDCGRGKCSQAEKVPSKQKPVRIYCETNALTAELKQWSQSGLVELVHFPYDSDSHTRRIPKIATGSAAQIRDLNLPIHDLPGTIGDWKPSEHFEEIRSIIGKEQQYRRDALHIDSAVKSGCLVFVTRDSDILKHKARLQDLLGIAFFDPKGELYDLEIFIQPCKSEE